MPGVRHAWPVVAGVLLLLAAAGAAASWWLSYRADGLVWLGGGPAGWIVAPVEPQTWARTAADLETTFERDFEARPGDSTMRVRALGRATLLLNGTTVARPDDFGPSWKRVSTFDVSGALRPGANTLHVSVVSAAHPAALNLALGPLVSDETWRVSIAGSSPRPARPATRHPRPDPGLPDAGDARPAAAFARSLPWLAAAVLLAAVAVLGLGRRPRFVLAAVILGWAALYLHNAGLVPLTTGFDAQGHLDYVTYLLERGALPLADEGWQMYQPPLFYLVCAGVVRIFAGGALDAHALRLVTFGAGIAQILLLGAIARVLWPGSVRARLLALGFGACLPMHLYLFHYVSNETLAATLNTLVSFLVLRLLAADRAPSGKACAGLGAVLGLAMLAKFSAVVMLPPAFAALGWQLYKRGGAPQTAVTRVALCAAAFLAVCAWHFGRVWAAFGNPLIGNWDPGLGFSWWQDPGFRTVADYASFGRSFTRPWYAGFAGVLDGAYSTFWGDALASGATEVQFGAPWNHRIVSAGYLLTPLPVLVIATGAVAGILRLVRGRLSPARSAAGLYLLALVATVLAALGAMTLRVPSYAQAKAFYLQPALAALGVAFVFGARLWLRHAGRWRPAVAVALVACGLLFYAAVWIRPASPGARVQQGYLAFAARDDAAAAAHFREALDRAPDHAGALAGLASVHVARQAWSAADEAGRRALELVSEREAPRIAARAWHARGRAAFGSGRYAEAETALRRAIELAPAELQSYRPLVRLLLGQGRYDEAAEVLRDQLWVQPLDPDVRQLLAELSKRRRSR